MTTATGSPRLDRPTADNHFRLGLLLAVSSALAFGSSGPFAKALMEAGWSPTAAVTARLAGGALAMAIFASIVRPGWVREAVRHARTVGAYGLVPIAGAQLCYYIAVAHLSVGEHGLQPPPMPRMRAATMAAEAAPAPLEGGESRVAVQVGGRIELRD